MRNIAAARSTEGFSRERNSGWMDEGANQAVPWKSFPVMDAPHLPKPQPPMYRSQEKEKHASGFRMFKISVALDGQMFEMESPTGPLKIGTFLLLF